MTAGQAPNITILSALHKAKKGWENEKRMVSAQNVTNSRSNVGLSTLIYTEYHHIAYFLNQVSNVWVSTKPVKIECEGVPDPGILEHLNNLLLSLPLFILLLLSSCTSLLFFFFCLLFFVLILSGFCFDKCSEVHCYITFFVQQYHNGYLEKCQQNSDDVGMGRACQALARAYEM